MIISVSGTPGSGKSTVARDVAKKLKLKYHSVGDIARDLAKKHKMSILEYDKLAETDENIDKELDDVQIELGNNEDNFVIDSRLGYYFIPHSIKIFLKCSVKEGAKRIFNDNTSGRKSSEKENLSLATAEKSIKDRMESDKKRYQQYYGLDFTDEKDYDLVIDTSSITPEKAADQIISFVKDFDKHKKEQEKELKDDEDQYFKVIKEKKGKTKGKNKKDDEDEDTEEDDSDDDFDSKDLDDEDDFEEDNKK
ncbi:MAG: cytidylate kinase family protein [Nanoarchaeota archaeon]|nr:cytidylate kinase family protein [Nanoarchaeota archaeon]